jgi:hypothetical protein
VEIPFLNKDTSIKFASVDLPDPDKPVNHTRKAL